MSELIFYDPKVEAGTVRERSDGAKVRYVAPEVYFPHHLGYVANATVVFLNIAPSSAADLSDEVRLKVDEAIADAYWNRYQGLVLPTRVMKAIQASATGQGAGTFLSLIETARQQILNRNVDFETAAERRIEHRVEALQKGASGQITDLQTSVAEAVIDLLYLERAAMQDILRAESERDPDQPRCDLLDIWDKEADLVFEDSLPVIIRAQPVQEAIPSALMGAIQEFSAKRRPYFREGIFKS